MKVDRNDLVVALSHALDFMEIDFLGGITNHSKRVAYIAARVAKASGFEDRALADLAALAILHDNGMGVAFQAAPRDVEPGLNERGRQVFRIESARLHCEAGEANLAGYPFLTDTAGTLLYHHENWDGSGFFGRIGTSIPPMARIIRLADGIELHARLKDIGYNGKEELRAWLGKQAGRAFEPGLVSTFLGISVSPAFWLDMGDEFIYSALRRIVPVFDQDLTYAQLRGTTRFFSRVIDSKSHFTRLHSQELSERAARMANRYGFDAERGAKLRIAADLHDLGKLAVGNAILDKPGKLDAAERDVIERHTYFTRVSLSSVKGFEEITEWAANHHERLDGGGYPFGLDASRLDRESRLLACLDIYQALTEERPYRSAMGHDEAVSILGRLAEQGALAGDIVADIDAEFSRS